MHTIEKGTVNVPAFLTKLWKIVEDTNYNNLICWSSKGKSFIIKNQAKFAKELLPLFFKHNNMASFIRQLNMYGFRKLTSIENSGLRTMDKDDMEFYHQYFVKGEESLLELIKRKATPGHNVLETTENTKKPEDINGLLNEIHQIKGRQESVEMLLSSMQKENETLWREVAILRQKSQKQQQLVDKLIHFLISLVRPRNVLKRKFPLMIDHIKGEKYRRHSGDSTEEHKAPSIYDVTENFHSDSDNDSSGENGQCPLSSKTATLSDSSIDESLDPLNILDPLQSAVEQTLLSEGSGLPTIPEELDKNKDNNGLTTKASDKNLTATSPLNTPPESPKTKKQALDLVPSISFGSFNREPFNDQLEGIETELGWLQEQISCGAFNIDSNHLLNLFNDCDTDLSHPFASTSSFLPKTNNEITGNELIEYVPTSTSRISPDELGLNDDDVSSTLLTGEEADLAPDLDEQNAVTSSETAQVSIGNTNSPLKSTENDNELDLDSFLNITK